MGRNRRGKDLKILKCHPGKGENKEGQLAEERGKGGVQREGKPVTCQERLSLMMARMVMEIYNMETAYNSPDL